jgi:hypothetical protein
VFGMGGGGVTQTDRYYVVESLDSSYERAVDRREMGKKERAEGSKLR